MSNRYDTPAVILSTEAKGEYDLWCVCFTKHFGKMRLLAKGARKPTSKLRSALQPLSFSRIEFVQGRIWRVVDAVLQDRHEELRSSPKSLRSALAVAALCGRLIQEKEPDRILWDHLLEALSILNNKKEGPLVASLAYYHFLWNLLVRCGYGPSSKDLKKEAPQAMFFVNSLLRESLLNVDQFQLKELTKEEFTRVSRAYLERACVLAS